MKLYVNLFSPNARRVRLTAAVLGLSLDEQPLDFTKGEHKTPAYLALNPNGSVPTLVDDDFVLTESRAIMQYLAVKAPHGELLPRDERARADVTRWQFWDAAHFSPQLGTIAFQKVFKPMFGMGEADPAKVEEALVNFRRFAGVLDRQLDGKQYVVGERLTVADLTFAASLMYARQSEISLAEFPRLAAWFERMSALEARRQTAP